MKRIIIIVISLVLLLLVMLSVSFLSSFKKTVTTPTGPSTIATPSPTPSPSDIFEQKNFDKFIKNAEQRPTQTPVDEKTRQTLIESLDNKTGILYSDGDVQISYLKGANDFEVEIKTNDIESAQQKAISYFLKKGFSKDGICKLPLFFFASQQVFEYLKTGSKSLNATPDFCQ